MVYTWVNGSDPKLIADLAYWKARYADVDESTAVVAAQLAYNATLNVTSTTESEDQAGANRFRDNQELRFSLRSIWKYAPWVRHVWIVTNGHVPYWINLDHPRVTLISHADIFPNTSHLPTFSSPAIETHLHRIPGIASKFIYFNDDVMLGNHITPDDFVTHGGGQKIFLSWNVPNCATGCPDTWLADNYCDSACNNKACEWDMGDCVNNTKGTGGSGSGGRDSRLGSWESSRGGSPGSKYCATGCPNNWVGDKVCDRSCKNAECAFDGGDCGLELIKTHLVSVDLPPTQHSYERIIDEDGSEVILSGNEFLLPFGTASLYVNLSTAFPGATSIVDASHDNPSLIRSAIVTQNLKVLTLILYDEVDIEENQQQEDEEAVAMEAAGSNVTAGIEVSSAHLGSTRRVEIFLQGELNGVLTNRTFNLTRPRFPSAEELAQAALEAESAAAASSTGPRDDRIVEDPDAMFAQAAAAAQASTEQTTRGSIHSSETQGGAATNANSQLRQADSVASAAVHDASSSSSDDPVPLSAGIGVSSGEDEDEQNPTLNSRRRRLLSAFDSLVGTLRAMGKDSTATSDLKPTKSEEPVDPSSPYQPAAGYSSSSSSHTRAYTSSPSSQRGVGPSFYSSEKFLHGGNDAAQSAGGGFWRESWRDVPVYVDSVPLSADIAHSGVKLREGLDETRRTQPGENLWSRFSGEESSSNPSDSSSTANALRDSTGRIVEAYGWSSEDHSLAASIRQHKQKQLWLSMREDARQAFMQAWRVTMREKRKEQEGRWERFVEGGAPSAGGGHDARHDSTFLDPASSSHTPSPSSPRGSPLSRFARDPVWPWELSFRRAGPLFRMGLDGRGEAVRKE